ncbi:MAG TPA: DUF58 domain-containing protein [Mycobacteriales bacterium]|nr:DUF58 domain-containing protein [Mycobacteriales bacterium]
MRRALAGLTTRGRSFLAAGAACVSTGLAFGERDLLRIGILLIALPLLALLIVGRARFRLGCTRRVDPPRASVGSPTTVLVTVENLGAVPTGVLLFEDSLPYLLGGRPRFVVDRLAPRTSTTVTYTARSELRGRYTVGPLSVRLRDPFGLCELTRGFAQTDTLVVTPAVVDLPRVSLGADWAGAGESRARSIATQGEDDVTVREYRDGDDLRRVHWRSTARVGEIMVRREEQPWRARAALLLDTRRAAHSGEGPASSFESAIGVAASVAVDLLGRGYSLRVVTDTAAPLGGPDGPEDLLDQLAVVGTSRAPTLGPGLGALRHGGGEGLVVAVVGRLTADDADGLARLRYLVKSGVVVLLDTPTWAGLPAAARAAELARNADHETLLAGAGWRVIRLGQGGSVAEAWAQVGAIRAGVGGWS